MGIRRHRFFYSNTTSMTLNNWFNLSGFIFCKGKELIEVTSEVSCSNFMNREAKETNRDQKVMSPIVSCLLKTALNFLY